MCKKVRLIDEDNSSSNFLTWNNKSMWFLYKSDGNYSFVKYENPAPEIINPYEEGTRKKA